MPEKLEGRAFWRAGMALSMVLGLAIVEGKSDTSNNKVEAVKAAKVKTQSFSVAVPIEIEPINSTTTTTTEIPPTTTLPPPTTTKVPEPKPPPAKVSGAPAEWMAAAGIPPENYDELDYIMSRESGWNPGARNSGGCIGLGQACPKGLRPVLEANCPDWSNQPVCQLDVFENYAYSRYGGWDGAAAHSRQVGWW